MPRNKLFFATVQNRVWALHPAKMEEMYLFFDRVLAGEKIEFPESAAGKSGNRAEEAYEIREGVAILPVNGIIDKRMNMFLRFSGGTSTEILARDFRQALADPQVEAILLDIDSPGGSVDGTKELADLILAAREQKPVVAYANGLMASGAYWIGAGAQAILAPETAEVGSIGVALMHYDYSAADQMAGVKRTAITGGRFKRIASDEKPLSKEGQEYLQGMVDDYYALFLEAIATARGFDPGAVHEKMADGRIFVGKKALKAGLIDQIGYQKEALALARAKGGAMPKNMTKVTLQAGNPELFQALLAEGAVGVTLESLLEKQPEAAEKLRAEGVKAERSRVMEILAMEGDAQISIAAIQEGKAAMEVAPALLKAEKEGRAQALAEMRTAAPPPAGQSIKVETYTEQTGDLPIEKQAMKAWDGPEGPKLKAEFDLFSTYLAFRQAEAQGQTTR